MVPSPGLVGSGLVYFVSFRDTFPVIRAKGFEATCPTNGAGYGVPFDVSLEMFDLEYIGPNAHGLFSALVLVTPVDAQLLLS